MFIKFTRSWCDKMLTPIRFVARYFALSSILLAVLLVVLDGTIMNVAMMYVARDLSMSLEDIQVLVTFYSLVMGALMLLAGRIADMWGRKRIFMLGVLFFGAGSLLSGFSQNGTHLLIGWSLLEGIGAAFMMPASSSMIISMFQGRMQKVAFALWGAMAAVGGALGPIVGGFVTKHWSWRYAFLGQATLSVFILLGVLFVKIKHKPKREPVDVIGGILVSSGVVSIIFGLLKSIRWGWFNPKEHVTLAGVNLNFFGISFVTWLIVLGLIFMLVWWVYEHRTSFPLVDPKILRIKPFRVLLLVAFLINVVQSSFFFVMPIYFQIYKRYDALKTGFAFLPLSLGVLVASMLSAKSKADDNKDLIRGAAVALVGTVITLLVFKTYLPESAITFAFVLLGIGVGYMAAPLTHLIMNSVPETYVGAASGLNSTLRRIGAALGTAISGSIFFHSLYVRFSYDSVSLGAHSFETFGTKALKTGGMMPPVLKDAMYYALSMSLTVVTLFAVGLFFAILLLIKNSIIPNGKSEKEERI